MFSGETTPGLAIGPDPGMTPADANADRAACPSELVLVRLSGSRVEGTEEQRALT